jgi:aminoglycoside phosphotransferase (APT) family kinase protein
MSTFPTSVDEITPEWLTEAIGHPVEAAEIEQIGAGIGVMSALYRARLTGDGCPETVVVKLPGLAEESVFTSTILRMYLREAAFFSELAAAAPVRVPACHHSTIDPETSQFVLVMEDLGGLRVVDQVQGMAIADAERAVDGLAAWHATWWGNALELAERGVTVSLGDPIYKAVLPMVFAEGWEKLGKELPIPEAIAAIGPRWSDAMPGLVDDLATEPTTMVHGDWRADNLLFQPDGSVAALDFQLIGTARGTYDLAYFVTQSLDPATARQHEKALFDRWVTAVEAAGAPPEDNATAWDDYRKGALFCLVYPVVAWRGMDAGDPRQVGLATTMLERFDRAAEDLDLQALL